MANAKKREVGARKKLESGFSPEIVAKIMSMMADDDGDGIPNFMDLKDNRQQPQRQFASEENLVRKTQQDGQGKAQSAEQSPDKVNSPKA